MALMVYKLTWVTCRKNCIDSMPKMWLVFYLLQIELSLFYPPHLNTFLLTLRDHTMFLEHNSKFGYRKLMKGKALRKHSLHEKIAASVLLKLFISSNE